MLPPCNRNWQLISPHSQISHILDVILIWGYLQKGDDEEPFLPVKDGYGSGLQVQDEEHGDLKESRKFVQNLKNSMEK
jgi:hypothetical protein